MKKTTYRKVHVQEPFSEKPQVSLFSYWYQHQYLPQIIKVYNLKKETYISSENSILMTYDKFYNKNDKQMKMNI